MAIQTKKIFIDSSVLIAFIDRADKNHAKAIKIFEDLAKAGNQLYTSSQSIQDTFSALSIEMGQSVALEFLQSSLQSDIEILFPQKADLITSYRILQSNRERQINLREAVNATLMQKKNIMQIATFSYWHNLFGTYVTNLSN